MTLSLAEFYSGEFAVYVAYSCHFVFLGVRRNRNLLKLFSSCVAFQLRISSVTLHPVHHLFTAGIHHHHLLSLNCEGRWGTTDDFATIFLHLSLFSTALWDLSNSRPVHGQAWSLPSQRAVENRERWRKLVAKLSVVPQRPSRLRNR